MSRQHPIIDIASAISVVVPVHDEADNVGPLAVEVDRVLAPFGRYEIVFVDDASRDDTAMRVESLRRRLPAVRLIRHHSCRGQSTAVWNGVSAARYARIAVLDGDLQNDPADIPRLLAARAAEPEPARVGLVIGHRRRRRDSRLRQFASRIANGVRSRWLGDRTPDTGCGLKVIDRALFMQLPYFDHMHRFMPALVQQLGYRVLSVPVTHRPRKTGRSKYGINDRLWVGIVDLFGVWWLARRNRRCVWSEPRPEGEEGAVENRYGTG
jgi:dolichol-phosphate mannosyltransferase